MVGFSIVSVCHTRDLRSTHQITQAMPVSGGSPSHAFGTTLPRYEAQSDNIAYHHEHAPACKEIGVAKIEI